MKKLITSITALLLVALTFAQTATTQEEYNYVTKGIANSITNGLDIKKGYLIDWKEDFSALDLTAGFEVDLYNLIRKKDSSLACFIVIQKWEKVRYWYCIPILNPDLYKEFTSSISGLSYEKNLALLRAFMIKSIENMQWMHILEKKHRDSKTKKEVEKILYQ